MKKVISFIIILAVFSSTAMPLYAKTVNDLKKEQNNLNSEANAAKSALDSTKDAQKTVFSEITSLDNTIATVEQELNTINNKLLETEQKIVLTQEELQEARIRKENQDETLRKRIKYLYENGNIGYLDVLLNCRDFSDFLNRMEYVNDIMIYDNEVFNEMKLTQETIERNVVQIEVEKKNVELLAKEQVNKKHGLEESKSQKAQVLAKLENDEVEYEKKIKQIDEDNAEIKRLIKKSQEEAAKRAALAAAAAKKAGQAVSSSKYTGGKMMWPVAGHYNISSPYGSRTSPTSGRKEFHTGIDIPAPYGTSVRAAADGVIITAKYLGSYGNAVIIDHGGGINTVYGHNSKLLVSAGQSVKKGDVIAKIGSTGNSTGNHSHFEVRSNGSTSSPIGYLTK